MNTSKVAVCVALLAVAVAPVVACESSSSSSGGIDAPDTGVFDPDGGDGGNVDPPVQSECVPPTKGPTMHQGGSSSDPDNQVWTADGSPHILPYDTTIYKTVTIEPCAEVLLAAGRELTVTGKLIAEGTATKRIHFGAKDAGQAWNNIRTLSPGTLRFAYTTLDGGGTVGNTQPYLTGVLNVAGDGSKPVQETLFVDHVTIAGSLSSGIVLTGNAGFAAGSNALVVKGAAQHPMSIWARAVGGIPVGSYTGNAIDKILLPTTSGNDSFSETTTLHERGVPYLVGHATSGGDLRVYVPAGQPPVTLTIEPGVEMRFKKGGVLRVGVFTSNTPCLGSLIAAGTAAKPIVFKSDEASPAPGDWLGLAFGDVPTAIDKVDHVRVENAGGTSTSGSGSCPDNAEVNNDGAIRISGPPPSQFITNTVIASSKTNGIDRGWRSDQPVISFLPTNMVTGVALCLETYPPTANNVCPVPVPCPQ